jgi:hypothetical protein
MLRESIIKLTVLLTTKLTPQEDKEIRAELDDLKLKLKHQESKERFLRSGGSVYGSYFDTVRDVDLN